MGAKRARIRQQLRRAKKPINPKYLAACYGKIRHTKDTAKKVVEAKEGAVRAYKCQFCDWYHVGRRPRNASTK